MKLNQILNENDHERVIDFLRRNVRYYNNYKPKDISMEQIREFSSWNKTKDGLIFSILSHRGRDLKAEGTFTDQMIEANQPLPFDNMAQMVMWLKDIQHDAIGLAS